MALFYYEVEGGSTLVSLNALSFGQKVNGNTSKSS